jgi:WD40 repeat protein
MAYAPSGRYVVGCDSDSRTIVWSVDTGSSIQEVASAVEASSSSEKLKVLSLAVLPLTTFTSSSSATGCAEERVAVGRDLGKVSVKSLPGLETLMELVHGGAVWGLSPSPCGSFLASVGGKARDHYSNRKADAKLKLWATDSSASRAEERPLCETDFDDVMYAVAFAPCGKLLAAGGEMPWIHIAVAKGNDGNPPFVASARLKCAAGMRCLSWTPCSRFLAAGGEDKRITVWDVLSKTIQFSLPEVADWFRGIVFSPKGGWLASCCCGSHDVRLDALAM